MIRVAIRDRQNVRAVRRPLRLIPGTKIRKTIVKIAARDLPRGSAFDRHHEHMVVARLQIAVFIETIDQRINHRHRIGPLPRPSALWAYREPSEVHAEQGSQN